MAGIQMTGLASGMDTKTIIADLMKVEKSKVDTVSKSKTMVEWKKEAWSDMNSKLYSFYKDSVSKLRSASTYAKKTLTSSDTNLLTVSSSTTAVNGSHTIEVTNMAKGSYLTGSQVALDNNGKAVTSATVMSDLIDFTTDAPVEPMTLKLSTDNGANYKEVSVLKSDTIADVVKKIQDLKMDINIGFDNNFKRLFVSSKSTGVGVQLKVDDGLVAMDAGDQKLLNALGIGSVASTIGANAVFKYNGTELSSATNDVTVNGMAISLKGEGGSATVAVNQDTDGIYETVKTFITKYNELMADINTKVGAESARKYQPLTTEEKDAMSETDIKLWEDKIKSALFRNDDILSSISSSMRGIVTLSSGVETTGFDFKSMSDLGIVTGNYTEKGKLHIEGDADESIYGLKENKLKTAIADNADGVLEFMTAMGSRLYDEMASRMKSTTSRSALSFYNDKILTKQVATYETKISDLEDKMAVTESRYYKQFTAMEQAIQKSNSTSSWLTQQLGGS